MANDSRKECKVIWAVDAFSDADEAHDAMGKTLASWASARSTDVEAVYVMSPKTLGVPVGFLIDHEAHLVEQCKSRLTERLRARGWGESAHVTILSTHHASNRDACRVLLQHARSVGAEVIGVTTHSRKVLSRVHLGSFAESLILAADVPVLVGRPQMHALRGKPRFLVPTDLDPSAAHAFDRILDVAKVLGARLTLMHVSTFIAAHPAASFGPPAPYYEHLAADLKQRAAMLVAMAAKARSVGVEAETRLIEEEMDPTRAILSMATESHADVIAVASRKTQVEAVLLGSIARKLIRRSPVPIWIMHVGD